MDTTTVTDAQAVEAMLSRGGRFMQRLALAWEAADPLSQARIKEAFRPEFERYRLLAGHAQIGLRIVGALEENLHVQSKAAAEAGPMVDMERAKAHYTELARQAAERNGEQVLPEHRA